MLANYYIFDPSQQKIARHQTYHFCLWFKHKAIKSGGRISPCRTQEKKGSTLDRICHKARENNEHVCLSRWKDNNTLSFHSYNRFS